jgi:GT2 family glycosyltransferase
MTGPRPEASVLVPHFNQTRLLALCLDSLERQTFPRRRFEIIVADNGTPGGVAGIAARHPNVRFLKAEERGAAAARNAAMRAARGEALAFIDADCLAAPDWLERGLEGLAAAPLSGGAIRVGVADERRLTPVEAFERLFAFRQRVYVERKGFAATANLFARAAAARAIGPFTNGLSEDVDWCRRAGALGFRLAFNDRAVVTHPARRDWSELTSKWDRLIAERWAEFRGRGFLKRGAWLGLSIATAASTAPHLLRVAAGAELVRARDRWAAAGVLARIRCWRALRMAALLCRE